MIEDKMIPSRTQSRTLVLVCIFFVTFACLHSCRRGGRAEADKSTFTILYGWGEWDYGFYTGGTTNASFWAPRIGRDRSGAWVLRNYSRVFQRLEGLEPDTEYGLSFFVYHPYVAGDVGRFDVIGRMVEGTPDPAYVYRDLTVTQDDAWEQVVVRARTDLEGRLYVGIEVGLSDADWLAVDDLMVWADPDGPYTPVERDCGAPNCDLGLSHHLPYLGRRHLGRILE